MHSQPAQPDTLNTECACYLASYQVHHSPARVAVSTPRRWARSPHDQRSHLLARCDPDQIEVIVGLCGHHMLWSVPISAHPTLRSCPTCKALAASMVPAPRFGDPPADCPATRPEVAPTMPADPDDHWRDVDGTPIPPLCRFEQVAVDAILGAAPARLHRYGRVIDRGITRLIVLFDDDTTLSHIQPHLVRVLTTP